MLNGGPGASAAYLHLGALGPRRVAFEDGAAPPPPPGSCRTRIPGSRSPTSAHRSGRDRLQPDHDGRGRGADRSLGTQPDLDALAAFIRLWLSRNERWTSPKFLVGESYGGFRVAALADLLAERHAIQVNGAVLISPVLEFSLHDGDDYTLLPWVLRVPSFAAVAHRHGKGSLAPAGRGDLEGVLAEVEAFSLAELLPGLARGDALAAPAAEALYQRLAAMVGLPPELVRRHAGRIPRGVFAKELLRADRPGGQPVRRILDAIDPDPAGSSARGDGRLTRVTASLAAAINDYLRRDLGYETDRPYCVLNRE